LGKILALTLGGGLHEKHEVQRGISVPAENLLIYKNKNYSFLMLKQVVLVHTPTTMP
jgi:hypothetical protein